MAPNPPQQQSIIIRKKKGGGHGGHHGGAWKVAYADFVTAMMAFFLLMWLLNVTTDAQRRGLADYFAPASISLSTSGAGGVMGGQTITTNGAQISDKSPPATDEEAPSPETPQEGEGVDVGKGDQAAQGKAKEGDKSSGGKEKEGEMAAGEQISGDKAAGNALEVGGGVNMNDAKSVAEAMQHEEEHFKKAESALKQAIEGSDSLKEFAQQLLVDRTTEGLRIQIVDQDSYSMFPSGSSIPYEKARELLRTIGKVIAVLPNEIAISGHTDSIPFSLTSRRDNWTLSTERANVSRSEIVYAGVDDKRIARVVGMAARDPLVIENPKDPKNRRISIVLLRQTLPPAEPEKKP